MIGRASHGLQYGDITPADLQRHPGAAFGLLWIFSNPHPPIGPHETSRAVMFKANIFGAGDRVGDEADDLHLVERMDFIHIMAAAPKSVGLVKFRAQTIIAHRPGVLRRVSLISPRDLP